MLRSGGLMCRSGQAGKFGVGVISTIGKFGKLGTISTIGGRTETEIASTPLTIKSTSLGFFVSGLWMAFGRTRILHRSIHSYIWWKFSNAL